MGRGVTVLNRFVCDVGTPAGNLTRGKPGRPDVITYTILVKGVCESNNMYAGTKIMQMYREMRQRYKIRPDRRLINSIVNSLAKARSDAATYRPLVPLMQALVYECYRPPGLLEIHCSDSRP